MKQPALDQIVKKAESIPLSGADVHQITRQTCNVLAYEQLQRYDNIDDVLGKHGAAVILYQLESNFGHWVSLFKLNSNTLYFFDSYGIQLDEELKFSSFNTRQHRGKAVPHLSHLISKSHYRLILNKTKFQQFKHDVNTCGRYAAHRILHRRMSEKDYEALLLDNDHYNADFWISILTIPSLDLIE